MQYYDQSHHKLSKLKQKENENKRTPMKAIRGKMGLRNEYKYILL